MSASSPLIRPGLAGGIDKDGLRAAELLGVGFGAVEFGTVTPLPEGGNPGVAALAARLARLAPRAPRAARIGIGIGMGSGAPTAALPAEWLAGLELAWGACDYLSFNLSARAYAPLLAAEHLPLLAHTFGAIAAERERRGGARVALALKLPLGTADALRLSVAEAAADAGFDAITAVLPDCPERLDRLHMLAARLRGKAALRAVGGIRCAADIRAAVKAGADGVQVHTVFAQLGAACLPALLAG